MSWFGYEGGNGYFLAKAAGWAATNGLRLELAAQQTQVTGVHIGVVDTDMSAAWPGAKLDPVDVVNIALDGAEAGAAEVLADDWSRTVKSYLQLDPAEAYRRIAAYLAVMAAPAD
jgi:NAD(P)-dependent dehydrogenase (short-subunit alcohol dehydrogenase family)